MSRSAARRVIGMRRADEIDTKRRAVSAFASSGSGRVVSTALALAAIGRLITMAAGFGGPSWRDPVVIVVTIAAVGIVEWVIHLFLLHASPDAWTSRRLGTGAGHRRHHLDPPDLGWLLLGRVDAIVFSVMIAVGTAAWTVPLAVVTSGSVVAVVLTGLVAAYVALWHYEWTHLLVHTRYRPRTRYYARLARNHRLHHFRNERYWLGVTTNSGDRLLGTYPADKRDVPLSETARTLT